MSVGGVSIGSGSDSRIDDEEDKKPVPKVIEASFVVEQADKLKVAQTPVFGLKQPSSDLPKGEQYAAVSSLIASTAGALWQKSGAEELARAAKQKVQNQYFDNIENKIKANNDLVKLDSFTMDKLKSTDSVRFKSPEGIRGLTKEIILEKAKSLGDNVSIERREAELRSSLETLSLVQSATSDKPRLKTSSEALDFAAGLLARGTDEQLAERMDFISDFQAARENPNSASMTKVAERLAGDRELVADIVGSAATISGEKLTKEHLDSITDFVHGTVSKLNPADRNTLLSGSLDLVKGLSSEAKPDLIQLASKARTIFEGLSPEGKKTFASNLVDFTSREAKLMGIKDFNIESAAGVVTSLFDKEGKLDKTKLDGLANNIAIRILKNPQTPAEREKANYAEQMREIVLQDTVKSIARNDPRASASAVANWSPGVEVPPGFLGLNRAFSPRISGTYDAMNEGYYANERKSHIQKDKEVRSQASSDLHAAFSGLGEESTEAIKFAQEIIASSGIKPKTDIRLDDMLALKSVQADLSTIKQTEATQALIAGQESHASQSGWQYYNAGTRADASGKHIERIYALKGSQTTLFEKTEGQSDWTSIEKQNQAQVIAEINALNGVTAQSTNQEGKTSFYSEPVAGESDEFKAVWTDPKNRKEILEIYNMGTIKTADGETLVTAVRKDGQSKPQVYIPAKREWQPLDFDLSSRLADIKEKTASAREEELTRKTEVVYQKQSQRYNIYQDSTNLKPRRRFGRRHQW
ncbi:MAG: hypothetical protein O3C63_01380 [Cyanobacteria bacterium]|nr:hypothetical protein [Cyanobacteriota bacterium]